MADGHLSQPGRLFIFARHGESAANTAHLVDTDPSHALTLSARGREQARGLGGQLANIDIDLAVGTRFLRTLQTIEIALQGRQIPIHVEEGFDEIRSGDLDGAPIEAYWSWKDHHPLNTPFPGGESVADAYRRYAIAVRRLLERTERVTLVVVHGLGLWSVAMGAAGASSPAPALGAFDNGAPYLFDDGALHKAAVGLDIMARPAQPGHLNSALQGVETQ